MPLGAPAQHAAGEVGDVADAGFLQDNHRLRGARAGAAYGHHRAVLCRFSGTRRKFPQRNQCPSRYAADVIPPKVGSTNRCKNRAPKKNEIAGNAR